MRSILWASALAAAVGSVPAAAAERGPSLPERGHGVVQACFHKHRDAGCERCEPACGPWDRNAVQIGRLICELGAAPRPCDRRRAADRLDNFNWQYHPEIVVALLESMQSDSHPDVREEAADALIDMRACAPDVIDAMRLTACSDCDKRVRHKASYGIKKLESCRPACLTYASSCPVVPNGPIPITPGLEPVPQPRPMPGPEPSPPPGSARRSVRSLFSTAVSRVKSRL